MCLLGFIRIYTHRRILENPMPPAQAISLAGRWLTQPHVHFRRLRWFNPLRVRR